MQRYMALSVNYMLSADSSLKQQRCERRGRGGNQYMHLENPFVKIKTTKIEAWQFRQQLDSSAERKLLFIE